MLIPLLFPLSLQMCVSFRHGIQWPECSLSVCFQVEHAKVQIKEGGVQLTLTIVDTPGFGDAVDNSNW